MHKILKQFICLLAFVCLAVLFPACGIPDDYTGNYQLVSFTADDGVTYSVGDTYGDKTLAATDVTLSLSEFGSAVIDNKNDTIKKFQLVSNVSDSVLGFYKKSFGKITMPDFSDNTKIYTATFRGSVVTIQCPSTDSVKEIKLEKVS